MLSLSPKSETILFPFLFISSVFPLPSLANYHINISSKSFLFVFPSAVCYYFQPPSFITFRLVFFSSHAYVFLFSHSSSCAKIVKYHYFFEIISVLSLFEKYLTMYHFFLNLSFWNLSLTWNSSLRKSSIIKMPYGTRLCGSWVQCNVVLKYSTTALTQPQLLTPIAFT